MSSSRPSFDFVEAGRAVLCYVSGCAMLWCLWYMPVSPYSQWTAWVGINVVALLGLPILIRAVFFDEGLGAYGFQRGHRRRVLWWSVGAFAAVLPLLLYACRLPEFQQFSPRLAAARTDPVAGAWYAVTVAAYMFAWEYFYRGFLLFSLQKGLGIGLALVLQAIPFGLMHWGKVPTEVYSSFGAGLALGWIAWRCQSFVPAFLVHTAANLTFNALVIHLTGTWL